MFWGFVLLVLLFWQVKTVQPKLALSCDSSASASPPLGLQMFAIVPAQGTFYTYSAKICLTEDMYGNGVVFYFEHTEDSGEGNT